VKAIILKTYSLLIMILLIDFYQGTIFDYISLTNLAGNLLVLPVIYHLIRELFFKNKSAQATALKIYSFAYVCFYVLWGLVDIILIALNMGHISGYTPYLMYLNGMLFLGPVLYILAKDIFHKSKKPRYIFIAYVVLLFMLAFMPEQLNEIGFYDTTSN